MAFINANFYDTGVGAPGFGVFVYKSDSDTRETVMASGYFNNTDDNINLTADDRIMVSGDEGAYTLRVDTVSSGTVTTDLADASTFWLPVIIANVSDATSFWTISPCDGVLSRVKVVIETALAGGGDDAIVGLELGGTNVTDGGSADIVTLTASGSSVGDVFTGTCDGANTVSEGTAIEVTCDGASSTASRAMVLVEVIPA